jgi:hypothetical protein
MEVMVDSVDSNQNTVSSIVENGERKPASPSSIQAPSQEVEEKISVGRESSLASLTMVESGSMRQIVTKSKDKGKMANTMKIENIQKKYQDLLTSKLGSKKV